MIKPEASMVLLKEDKKLNRDDLLYFLQKHKDAYSDINPEILIDINELNNDFVKDEETIDNDGTPCIYTTVDDTEALPISKSDEFGDLCIAFTNISVEPNCGNYPYLKDGDEKNCTIQLSTCLDTSERACSWYKVYNDKKKIQYDENGRCLLNHCETKPTKIN